MPILPPLLLLLLLVRTGLFAVILLPRCGVGGQE